MSGPVRPGEALPDETLALGVVVSGVLVLGGSEGLHVAWLVFVGVASVVALIRRPGDRPADGEPPPP